MSKAAKAKPGLKSAVARINARGALLVFPVNNKPEPLSLWSEFYPRTRMRWEWNETGDNKVGEMWLLMKRLSDCREVVYSKWHQGRATFFSIELFVAVVALMRSHSNHERGLSETARAILEVLQSDSPLSTKELKKVTGLQGRENEGVYGRAMKELFSRFLIVAFGEVEDGAFPSLAVGATEVLYEDLWRKAGDVEIEAARATVERWLPPGTPFRRYFDKVESGLAPS